MTFFSTILFGFSALVRSLLLIEIFNTYLRLYVKQEFLHKLEYLKLPSSLDGEEMLFLLQKRFFILKFKYASTFWHLSVIVDAFVTKLILVNVKFAFKVVKLCLILNRTAILGRFGYWIRLNQPPEVEQFVHKPLEWMLSQMNILFLADYWLQVFPSVSTFHVIRLMSVATGAQTSWYSPHGHVCLNFKHFSSR